MHDKEDTNKNSNATVSQDDTTPIHSSTTKNMGKGFFSEDSVKFQNCEDFWLEHIFAYY